MSYGAPYLLNLEAKNTESNSTFSGTKKGVINSCETVEQSPWQWSIRHLQPYNLELSP